MGAGKDNGTTAECSSGKEDEERVTDVGYSDVGRERLGDDVGSSVKEGLNGSMGDGGRGPSGDRSDSCSEKLER